MKQLKNAFLAILKRPGPSALAILALALGIGLVTVQFNFIKGVMLQGLPFRDSDRIYHLSRWSQEKPGGQQAPFRDYRYWRENQASFEDLAAFNSTRITFSAPGKLPLRYRGALVTASFFQILEVQPLLGRTFLEEDDRAGAESVAVLGHTIWQRDFGGDAGVVGRTVRINGEPATIVGVMPERFEFPVSEELWVNLREFAPELDGGEAAILDVFGRLKSDTSMEKARAEFGTLASRLAQEFPESHSAFARVKLVRFIDRFSGEEAVPLLLTMLAMAAGVFLIACANVANLLLALASRRSRELAIRTSLGASRRALIFQMLSESMALALCGAAGGMLIAFWGTRAVAHAIAKTNAPFWFQFDLDGRTLIAVTAATVAAGLLSGLLPALRSSKVDISEILKDDTRASSGFRLGRLSRSLVVLQVALSCGLLVTTGLMAKSVVKAQSPRLPYDPAQFLIGQISLLDPAFTTQPERIQFFETLLEEVRSLPGVAEAGVTSRHPTAYSATRFEMEGVSYSSNEQKPLIGIEIVSPGYFEMLRIPLRSGRTFSQQDGATASPVVIISDDIARTCWPGEDPIGKRIRRAEAERAWATVVGVVGATESINPRAARSAGTVYLSHPQEGQGWMSLIVRCQIRPDLLANPVRETVHRLAPEQPIDGLKPLAASLAERLQVMRLISTIFIVFASVATFLAAIGIYGVTAFSVSQRMREFAVRIALGATFFSLLRLILRSGLRQLLIGLALGLALAFALSRPLSFLLIGVSPNDPQLYIGASLFVVVVALVAMWVPARRAGTADLASALRNE